LEGERKQVTVLFADLKGSMELLADRDPEEARKILDPVLELMMDAVHRYEGTVNQIMGDGIMALFGAPLAHEDHAVRACYAALRMQEQASRHATEVRRTHGANVKIRVGLNSGEVVVRAIGSDLHMDYTAVGQTTHLAARMEQIADPGAIAITSETLALVEGYIAVKSLGPVPVKGLAGPVEVYEVTGAGPARTRLQASAQRGLTQFVGRDAELLQLHRAQHLASINHGQVAAIVGEAGVGKSRLVYEFTHSHRMQGWLVLESASASYGKATSYLPVIDLLKGYFKIQDRDDLREIREKVTGKLLALDEALKPTLPALLDLCGCTDGTCLPGAPVDDAVWLALAPAQRRQRILDGVRRLLLREAREQPLLLIFEDLHWIDSETQALLDGLVESLGSTRLLLLVNYRPEYQHNWGSKMCYTQVRLDALPAERAGELLDGLLGDDVNLVPLKQRLDKRGNPFFLEETVRTLVETKALTGERGRYRLAQPVQTIQVPSTVQVILAARIDRLAPEDKRLLQIASVIGKDVPLSLLQTIAELPDDGLRRGLERLQAAEFVYEAGLFPDLEYSFKHALTHEITYGGLLQERRRTLHGRIVDAIETIHRDRLGEHTERLAHHASRGALGQRAVDYLRQAGRKAAARSALRDAMTWYEQGLADLESLPKGPSVLEQAFDIRLELRGVLAQLGEIKRGLALLREAEALAEQLNDEQRRGRLYASMTNIHTLLGAMDEALAFGSQAMAIARARGDLQIRITATTHLEQAHYYLGDYARVVELGTENLAALPADRIYDYFGNAAAPAPVYDRYWMVMSLAQLGRFVEAVQLEAEATRLAEPTRHAYTIAFPRAAASTRLLLAGDWATARAETDRWLAGLRSARLVLPLPRAVASAARVLAQLGEATEAQDRLQEAEQLLERHAAAGIVDTRGWDYHLLGRCALLLGQLDEARRLARHAVESAARHPGFAAHALHLLGDIATHPDHLDASSGEAHYRGALGLAESRGMRPLVAHCHLGLGKLYRRTGNQQKAREHLTTATAMYREMDMRFYLEQAETEVRS
jgi:class 3 adenylate cyclase/tetratricopeptide (TPR) repeat protein